MKRVLLLLSTLLAIVLWGCNKEDEEGEYPISLLKACEIVKPYIDQYPPGPLLVAKDPIPANKTLKYGLFGNYDPSSPFSGKIKTPNFKSWLIVRQRDASVEGSWDCNHFFVNAKTGEVVEMVLTGYFEDIDWDGHWPYPIPYEEESYEPTPWSTPSTPTKTGSSNSSNGRYAVIISGGGRKQDNWKRYWNDCQEIYNMLNHTLGYSDDNIYCLVSDGTSSGKDRRIGFGENDYDSSPLDFDNDGDNDIQYSATKSNISTVFNILQSQRSSISQLLVFITDHGDSGKICLWNNNTLSPSELDVELDKLSEARIDIVMGQCYSGAFVAPLSSNNRTIATACTAGQLSYAAGYFTYDHFLHWWTFANSQFNYTASLMDTNSDGMYSLKEIFNYAVSNDPKAADGSEIPQYASTPAIFGYTHDLEGNINCPNISGSDHLTDSSNEIYTISGLPASTTVTWTSTSDISLSNSTNTNVTASGNIQDYSQYLSFPNYIYADFVLEGDTYQVYKHIRSVWRPGVYYRPYGSGTIYGGNGQYTLTEPINCSGFYWFCNNNAWQILTQGSIVVQVSEGATSDPVNLGVTFTNPFGETIVVSETVKL